MATHPLTRDPKPPQTNQPGHDAWERWRHAASSARAVKACPVGYTGAGLRLALGEGVHGFIRRWDLWPRDAWSDPAELVGRELEGLVVGVEPRQRGVLVSPRKLATKHFRDAQRRGRRLRGRVTGVNPGGVLVEVGGFAAFVPQSQLRPRELARLATLPGRRWRGYVLRANRDMAILSSLGPRARARIERRRRRFAEHLALGMTMTGTVMAVEEYGAFVRLHRAGVNGLIRRDELSWWRVRHPADVVTEGQRLRVRVEELEAAPDSTCGYRIGLSHRAVSPNPWLKVAEALAPGSTVQCRVSEVSEAGAFLRVIQCPRVEAFLHRERTLQPALDPRERLRVGDLVPATVQAVIAERGRIVLLEAS